MPATKKKVTATKPKTPTNSRSKVDPKSGRQSKAKNAVPAQTYRNRQLVNLLTGEPAKPSDNREDIGPRSTYEGRKLVHPESGDPYEGEGAITSSAYRNRRSRGKLAAQKNQQDAKEKKPTKVSAENKKRKRNEKKTKTSRKRQKITHASSSSLTADDIKNLEEKCGFEYLPSRFDKPKYVYVKKVNLLNKGYGVYAAERLPPKTILGAFTGKKKLEHDTKSHYRVSLTGEDGTESKYHLDAKFEGNFTRFFNCSGNQDNVIFIKDDNYPNEVFVQTKREIQAHEQLLSNYDKYNPDFSAQFYFLNVDDNWQSSSEFLEEHKNHYQLYCASQDFTALDIMQNEKLYVTPAGMAILNNKKLKHENFQSETLHFRFLKAAENSGQTCEDFNQFDTFNALMLACYFGQVKNVEYLINKGVDLNKQQNISGQSALFFALQGVKDKESKSEDCVNVIRMLVQNKANIFIQDNRSQLFLYDAIQYLSTEETASILDAIGMKNFLKITNYVNELNEDVFYFSIRHKRLDMLNLLLKYCPSYFKNNKHTDFYKASDLKKLLEFYTAEEKEELKNILTAYKMPQDRINEIFDLVSNEKNDLCDVNAIDESEIVTATIVSEQQHQEEFEAAKEPLAPVIEAQPFLLSQPEQSPEQYDLLQSILLINLKKMQELELLEAQFSKAEEGLNLNQEWLSKTYQSISQDKNNLTEKKEILNQLQLLQNWRMGLLKQTQANIKEEKQDLKQQQKTIEAVRSQPNHFLNTPRVYTHSYPQLIFAGSNNHSSRIAGNTHLETAPKTKTL